jgi:hypothetical protein
MKTVTRAGGLQTFQKFNRLNLLWTETKAAVQKEVKDRASKLCLLR